MLGLSIRMALFDCELQITVRDYLANSVSDFYIRICLGEILAAKAKVHVCMAGVPPWYLEPFAMLVVLSGKKPGVRTFCTLLTFQKYQCGKLGSLKKLPSCRLQIAERLVIPSDQAHRGKAGFDASWWLRMIADDCGWLAGNFATIHFVAVPSLSSEIWCTRRIFKQVMCTHHCVKEGQLATKFQCIPFH